MKEAATGTIPMYNSHVQFPGTSGGFFQLLVVPGVQLFA